jgi:hypothetical protein
LAEEIWLQANARSAFDAFALALDAVARIVHACGHIVVSAGPLQPFDVSLYVGPGAQPCSAYSCPPFRGAIKDYLASLPPIDEKSLLGQMREATARAAYQLLQTSSKPNGNGDLAALAQRAAEIREAAEVRRAAKDKKADRTKTALGAVDRLNQLIGNFVSEWNAQWPSWVTGRPMRRPDLEKHMPGIVRAVDEAGQILHATELLPDFNGDVRNLLQGRYLDKRQSKYGEVALDYTWKLLSSLWGTGAHNETQKALAEVADKIELSQVWDWLRILAQEMVNGPLKPTPYADAPAGQQDSAKAPTEESSVPHENFQAALKKGSGPVAPPVVSASREGNKGDLPSIQSVGTNFLARQWQPPKWETEYQGCLASGKQRWRTWDIGQATKQKIESLQS